MKQSIKFILLFSSFPVLLFSCRKLDETIYSSIYTEAFYKTASDAEKGLIAAYDPLADLAAGPALTIVSDFSADQAYPRAVVGRNTLTMFTYDANYTIQKSNSRINESPQQIWTSCYDGIEKANWIIEKVPAANMDAVRQKQIIGEAYFLRAFYHWTAAKNFGDIPVKIKASVTEAEALVRKSSKAEVYKQIYSDLDQAANAAFLSYPAVDKGRPSKEAVSALYAKVALYNEDWTKALQKAQEVITSGKYALIPDVRDVFRYDREDVARIENIWAFEAEGQSPARSSQLSSLLGPAGSAAPEYGKTTFGSMFAYQTFFNSFNPLDKRRTLLDTNYVDKSGNIIAQRNITPITPQGVLIKKHMDPNGGGGVSPIINIPILRIADIYLIAAEAEFRLNGSSANALSYINAVRRRAFGLPINIPSAFDLTTVNLNTILQERSWELFAEGDRWYDLTRTNTFLTEVPKAVNNVYPTRTPQQKHRYFPIPQDEINANPKIEQNPEWK